MKKILVFAFLFSFFLFSIPAFVSAQEIIPEQIVNENDTVVNQLVNDNYHQAIKKKFIEGSAFFMSFIALALVAGLAFCLERVIYLNLSQVNTKKLLSGVESALEKKNIEEAKSIARGTRGPVAAITYQALSRIEEEVSEIDKSVVAYGSVQIGLLEKNLSWITLFIASAPSLGFLGTVVGMIQAFDKIQQYGDISPSIVAGGMKVALITTVGGLIVALILQVFYNYILAKVEEIIGQMEDDSIHLMDMVIKYKHANKR